MNLDEYLSNIKATRKTRFETIRSLIMKLYPDAIESMRYKMPTYECHDGWVALADQKNYISLYTCGYTHIAQFKLAHPNIKTGKGCINFQDKDDIPVESLKAVIHSAMKGHL